MSGLCAVVPTLGASRWLAPCLEALRRQGREVEIVLVCQGAAKDDARTRDVRALADRVLDSERNLGFAAATNLGASAASGEYLATVNDDALVGDGWAERLLEALEQDPRVAAVQGVNVRLDDPGTVDGAGLAWNRHWQAVQIGHGERPAALPQDPSEVFGVSATAAIYRRRALSELAGADGGPFDARLFAYYEDVDLAGRLRAAGHRALSVPAGRVRHAGSVSGAALPGGHRRLIYGNRHLVLARLLGRAFWPRWPRIVARDLADLGRAAVRGDAQAAAGIVAGAARALFRGPVFARFGPPLVPLDDLRRFRIDPP